MYSLAVSNKFGEKLTLTNNPDYIVTNITGLAAAGNVINTSTVSGADGEQFNSSRIAKRNIVITILPNAPVDENRNRLYRYFTEKGFVRIYYKNRIRNVYIDGVVETLDGNLFSMRQELQISILCPNPYFVNNNSENRKIVYSSVVPLLEFPYSPPEEGMAMSEILDGDMEFDNGGTVETGATIHITINVKMNGIRIQDMLSKEYIGVDYVLQPYDNLYIHTTRGEKGIYLLRNGERYNLINRRLRGSSWIKVKPGKNKWKAITKRKNYLITIEWKELYEGV